MTAPEEVARLVERFEDHRQEYRSGRYNEAQLRQDFLNPLFAALGWDVYNRKDYSEVYREVIHEYSLRTAGHTKAPDYCFRAAGPERPSFFVEAKRPSVDIREVDATGNQIDRVVYELYSLTDEEIAIVEKARE